MKINQTYLWEKQSERYVKSYLNFKINYDDKNIKKFFSFFYKKKIKNILDIGCGNGEMLNFFLENISASNFGVGVEPSYNAIKLLKKKNIKKKKINFLKAFAHKLPFKDNNFDLVISWSVLHWIDRNNYLQSLGEITRVAKKYLLILDFAPQKMHKVLYIHKKNFFTYKHNYDQILKELGFLKKIKQNNIYVDNLNNYTLENQLNIKKNSFINSFRRSITIYKKEDHLLQKKVIKNSIYK